ncbi:MFS family permease [Evansella vedderi]|uniref:MFS family permease n=1 Tax=Evansella vedderi TaxID=38282 RepID=A0ABT9ZNZ8_9BACI|nr:MFS transporter [Evansella vedderi]MDQ0252919.1 MFS family permease [Evansella vedderi]
MTTNKQPIWTKNFLSISFLSLLVFITFYTLLTTLPIYVIYSLEGTEAQAGLVVTMMLLSSILVRPFSGNLMERLGKRNVLIGSTIAFAVISLGYIWVEQFVPLMILRFMHGVAFGLLTTTTSTIAADILPVERKGEGLGYFTLFMNMAIVIGPFFGLTLIQLISFQQLFITLSILVVFSVLCAMLVKLKNVGIPALSTAKKKLSIHDFFEFKAVPVSIISALVAFAYAGILSFISVYSVEIGLGHLSGYFFLVFAFMMLLTRPYLGRLFDQRGPQIVIIPCLITFSAGFIILSVAAESPWLFLIAAGVIGVGYGSLLPFLLSLSIKTIPPSRNGHGTSTFFTLYDSGVAAGSFLLGLMVPYIGFSNLYIFLAGLVLAIAVVFYLYQKHMEARKNNEKKQGSRAC